MIFFYNLKTPQVGFEPTTNRLTADRSTPELLRNCAKHDIILILKHISVYYLNILEAFKFNTSNFFSKYTRYLFM